MKEFILCAAIHFNDGIKRDNQAINIESGFIITGRRHHDCYAAIQAIGEALGISDAIVKTTINKADRDHQGFITSTNRYVNRSEAMQIAKSNNQIFHNMHDGEIGGILISEDLY